MRLTRPVLALSTAAALAAGGLLAGSASAATDDPYRAAQYGLDQVRAEQAWAAGATGAGAVVAVVDSGVDLAHEDLQGQLVAGATFTGCKQTAPCGNGDFRGPDGENDQDEHGTHVAGIVAAAADNGVGIAGVARDAKIMPVKVLEAGSGSFDEIAAGIRWSADNGADVINLSLGALAGVGQVLSLTGLDTTAADAVAYARSKGVVVVAAAGNDFQFPLCGTPAFEDGALCVTSTDKREAPSAFSNNGLKPDLLAVAGPGGSLLPVCGEDIVSTVPSGTGLSTACGYTTAYDEYAGTSMATPHVAGVAALLAAQGKTDVQILDTLLTTSRQGVTGLRGVFTPQYGWGIVDAAAAVGAVSTPVEQPTEEPTTAPTTEPTTAPTTEPTKEPKPRPTRGPKG